MGKFYCSECNESFVADLDPDDTPQCPHCGSTSSYDIEPLDDSFELED